MNVKNEIENIKKNINNYIDEKGGQEIIDPQTKKNYKIYNIKIASRIGEEAVGKLFSIYKYLCGSLIMEVVIMQNKKKAKVSFCYKKQQKRSSV